MRDVVTYKAVFSKSRIYGLLAFIIIGLLHNFIANDKAIISFSDEGLAMFKNQENPKWEVKALIPYSSNYIDKNNRSVGPFDRQNVSRLKYRHWLGTDSLGRDVMAGIVHGTYIALIVGTLSVVLSFIIALMLSYLSGYYGDQQLMIDRKYFYWFLVVSCILMFYIIYASLAIKILGIAILSFVWIFAIRKTGLNRKKNIALPMDIIVFRMIDIFNSIPGLFLILIMLALFQKASIMNVILVIGILRWPVITRYLRAEILKIREEEYINTAKLIAMPDHRIFMKYIFPMAVSPVIIVLAFGFSAAVLTESTLSFLGLGIPADEVTWGSIIKQARLNFKMWWLALFPGIAIYLVVVLFNSIGKTLNDILRGQVH